MGFRKDAYATVWECNQGEGNFHNARLSISKKKQEGEYETTWSGFARLIGKAHEKADNIGEKSRIKILECDVTNSYNKEKKVTYTNYQIFDFDDVSNGEQENNDSSNGSFMNVPEGIDDELPFV